MTGKALSPRTVRSRTVAWAGLLAAALTAGLMVYGGWVRASGSGLGCPDWVLCKGAVLPELERATAIELGHRIFAGVTILAAAVASVVAYRQRHANPLAARLLMGALGVMLLQAGVGGVVVLTELSSAAVVVHLLLAMTTLALLTVGSVLSLGLPPPRFALLGGASALLALAGVVAAPRRAQNPR